MGVLNAALQHSPVISPSEAPVKWNILTKLPPIEALGIESVCCAGGKVAIRFATAKGIQPVYVPLLAFNRSCRAALDSNNRPFAVEKKIMADLEADAAKVPVTKFGPRDGDHAAYPNRRGKNGRATHIVARMRAIWEAKRAGKDARVYNAIGAEVGCTGNCVGEYFRRWDYEAELAKRSEPIRKPSGKLL